jgi:P-type Cu+ transporter
VTPDETPAAPLDFRVDGMACASCARAVEGSVQALAGIELAEVNFALRSLRVTVRGEPTAEARAALGAAVVAALERGGFAASPQRTCGSTSTETTDQSTPPVDEGHGEVARLAVAGFFTMLSMLPAMVLYLGMDVELAARGPLAWLSGVVAAPVLIYGGWPFYRRAWAGVRHARAGMDALVTLGVWSTVAVSAWQLVLGSSQVYFDSAAMIVTLLLAGRAIEAVARRRGGDAVEALRALTPTLARVRTAEGERSVPVAEVAVGDAVVVGRGERIPVDGTVLEGRSETETSFLTGEWAPILLEPGACVYAGTRNGGGVLVLSATSAGGKTVVDRIARDVHHLLGRRAPLQSLADRLGTWLTPTVLLVAAGTGITLLARGATATDAVLRAVAVVVVACPCALGLAVPMVLMVAAGHAAQRGILFRDADAIERAATVSSFAFDKTGTLTNGRPVLASTATAPEIGVARALAIAARLEQGVAHPFAEALRRAAPPAALAGHSTVLPGRGVVFAPDAGHVAGEVAADPATAELVLGNARFLLERGVSLPAEAEEGGGRSCVFLARGETWLATFGFDDTPAPHAREVLAELERRGFPLRILSGDQPSAARSMARQLGFGGELQAGLLPEDKARHLVALGEKGGRVAFVGDGLNDGPALAAAHLGVAVEGATEVAAAAAHVVLLAGGLARLPEALTLARRTRALMLENLAWAVGYNLLAIPAAAAGYLSPAIAAALMGASSVSVVLNALRLGRMPRGAPVSRPTVAAVAS